MSKFSESYQKQLPEVFHEKGVLAAVFAVLLQMSSDKT